MIVDNHAIALIAAAMCSDADTRTFAVLHTADKFLDWLNQKDEELFEKARQSIEEMPEGE